MMKYLNLLRHILTTGSKNDGLLYVKPKGKLTIKERLKIIKYAKKLYVKDILTHGRHVEGMCHYVVKSLVTDNYLFSFTNVYIPEFNYENFISDRIYRVYWWPKNDYLSRLKAFNLLIRSYKHYLKNNKQ